MNDINEKGFFTQMNTRGGQGTQVLADLHRSFPTSFRLLEISGFSRVLVEGRGEELLERLHNAEITWQMLIYCWAPDMVVGYDDL